MRNEHLYEKDSTGQYLDEIAKTPLLDAETEVELSKTIEGGMLARKILDGEYENYTDASEDELEWLADEGDRAVIRFQEANLRLVVSIAKKYLRSGMPMLDLIQEGNTGLIRAVEKFDYQKGYKFSTYATWWIRQSITRGIAQQGRVVRLPVHVVEELNQVLSAQRRLESTSSNTVEPEDIARELDAEVDRVKELLTWGQEHRSLDTPLGEDSDATYGDLIAQESVSAPEDEILSMDIRERLGGLLELLDDRSADIIEKRYGLKTGKKMNLKEIGVIHDISAERIRQLERQAILTLQKFVESDLAEEN